MTDYKVVFIGYRTKIGCSIICISAVLNVIFPFNAIVNSAFMCGVAISFFGMYERNKKSMAENTDNISDLKKRIKKPILRTGL